MCDTVVVLCVCCCENKNRTTIKRVGSKFVEDFNSKNDVVSIMPSCTAMVAKNYDTFFRNTSYHNIYRGLQNRVFEFGDYLLNRMQVTELPSRYEGKVAIHTNCQAVNTLHQPDTSQRLLQMVSGLELVYTKLPGTCCGYAGDYAASNEKGAIKMANDLMDQYEASGAEIIVSNDYHCLLHFKTIVKKSNRPLRFMHLAEVLAQGI